MRWQDIPRNPEPKMLRQFAGLGAVVFGFLAAWQAWHETAAIATYVCGGLAGTCALLGWLRPAWLRPIFVGWMIVAFPIGWLIGHLCLALIFFGVFLPLALWFRIIGRDVLRLRRPTTDSYWEEKPMPADVRSYFRQF